MSVASFIEEVINTDIDLTECQIKGLTEALKNAYEAMNRCFKGTSTQDRHLRPYKSLIAKEMIQKKRHEMPDIFYNFVDENVNIYVWKAPSKYYWIACRHWTLTKEEMKAIFYEYDLFTEDTYNYKMLEDNGQICKYLPEENLDKTVWAWRKIIRYYVQQSNRNNNLERYKTKIY